MWYDGNTWLNSNMSCGSEMKESVFTRVGITKCCQCESHLIDPARVSTCTARMCWAALWPRVSQVYVCVCACERVCVCECGVCLQRSSEKDEFDPCNLLNAKILKKMLDSKAISTHNYLCNNNLFNFVLSANCNLLQLHESKISL